MNPLYTHIVSSLRDTYGLDEAREMAFWILEAECGWSRSDVLACKDTKNISNIEIILQRLLKKEPIQYIFGQIQWLGLDLELTPDTLIPRPETAELVDWISHTPSSHFPLPPSLLDIGTGSGCIAIALRKAHPDWQVTGLDFSSAALEVARRNAQRNGVEVHWIQADILTDEIAPNWDIVVSNPPYICESEKTTMSANVLDYEPHSALFVPDSDPLLFYRRIAQLRLGQWLYFEINERFGAEVAEMLHSNGYIDIEIKKDIYGKDRMVRGRLAQ